MSREMSNTGIRRWLDTAPHETALLEGVFAPPRYARKTIIERVEPWATQYDEQKWELPWHEDGEPDPKFYQPTPLLIELRSRLDALYAKGFREVPNPAYDPERAAEWYKERSPINQTKHEWGQSYYDESD